MRRLHTLDEVLAWLRTLDVQGLQQDHRALRPGDAFLAWPGARHDARQHVGAALQAGACAVLVEADVAPAGFLRRVQTAAGVLAGRVGGMVAF